MRYMRHNVTQSPTGTGPAIAATPGWRLGSLIGGVFGLIYVEVNAGSLPRPWPIVLRIVAAVAFAGLAVALARSQGTRETADGAARGFGTRYWLVVAGEAAAIPVGAAVLAGPAGLPRAVVAWVSVVVGVHFLVLAAIWRLRLFGYLGAGIALCGAAGLAAAASGASPAVIAAAGGVLPGALLLVAGYQGATGALRAASSEPAGPLSPRHHVSVTSPSDGG